MDLSCSPFLIQDEFYFSIHIKKELLSFREGELSMRCSASAAQHINLFEKRSADLLRASGHFFGGAQDGCQPWILSISTSSCWNRNICSQEEQL